ncbi:helix-turn-helix domain-containing protein [Kitasatospora sp. NPDC058397]|uniref:helix-turn-helix domain-containing protein n=1 Tax=unclassified Kitasatospora TaxID=2633591 RepID=UPI003668B6DE
MSSSAESFRDTVASLLNATGETQTVLAGALGITQGQVSRKQNGSAAYTLDDVDAISAHYGIPVPELMCGPTHALSKLPRSRRAALIGGRQQVLHVVPA